MDNPNLELDTEDKQAWVERGVELENAFIETVAPRLGLRAIINPEKDANPYAPDLIVEGEKADLKCQFTPFFTADQYGKEPSRTVTFNRKDLERYLREYPDLKIYFYVYWNQTEYHGGKKVRVKPVHGVWRTDVNRINELVKSGRAPEHCYRRRVNDQNGNATTSFLLSLDDLELVGLIDPTSSE